MYDVVVSIRIRIREQTNKLFSTYRRKRLERTDVTIISNNCWAGHVYRYFGSEYFSPTIGLFFFADDYLVFLKNLRGFLSQPLKFIDINQSKYKDELLHRGYINVPIGTLSCEGETIELIFLHYKTNEEALEKWNRRVKRVNYDNLIIKNSYMNLCNDELVKEFDKLPYRKKFIFVHKSMPEIKSAIYFKGFENENEIKNDTTDFKKYIDLVKLINS